MKRWLAWLGVVVALAALIGGSFPVAQWWRERSAPKYLTATVTRGRIETVVNSTGAVKPVRTVSVGAFVSGPIKEIYVDFNSEITQKDQVLALIDDKLLKAASDREAASVDTAEAELKRIEAQLEQAERNLKRAEKLRDDNPDKEFISATEMDQFTYAAKTLQAQKKLAGAAIRQAKASYQNSLDNLGYTKIVGPKQIDHTEPDPAKRVKGKVIERKVDPGQTVAASFQTPELFTIALEMDKHLHLYASVDEADVGMIRIAKDRNDKLPAKERKQLVKFTVDAYPGELFEGDIFDIRLNSTTTQNVVTYPVIIDAPNREQKLMPGMTANITFQIEAKENVLRVPAVAMRFTPAQHQVHPEDRHYLEAITSAQVVTGQKRSAHEKANMAVGRHKRVVWIQDGRLLRAVPIALGLMENQYVEVIAGELAEGQTIVTGVEGPWLQR
jgi:HlyD family secretion protein